MERLQFEPLDRKHAFYIEVNKETDTVQDLYEKCKEKNLQTIDKNNVETTRRLFKEKCPTMSEQEIDQKIQSLHYELKIIGRGTLLYNGKNINAQITQENKDLSIKDFLQKYPNITKYNIV